MRCVINTNMRTDRFATNRNFAQFILAELFQRKNILNVRVHLNWTQIPTVLRREFATKIARRFRNNISRFYFPDARNGNFAVCVIYLHEDDCPHLHILVELPCLTPEVAAGSPSIRAPVESPSTAATASTETYCFLAAAVRRWRSHSCLLISRSSMA